MTNTKITVKIFPRPNFVSPELWCPLNRGVPKERFYCTWTMLRRSFILILRLCFFSRYHYYGITIKTTSPYHDTVCNAARQSNTGYEISQYLISNSPFWLRYIYLYISLENLRLYQDSSPASGCYIHLFSSPVYWTMN